MLRPMVRGALCRLPMPFADPLTCADKGKDAATADPPVSTLVRSYKTEAEKKMPKDMPASAVKTLLGKSLSDNNAARDALCEN